MKYMFAIIAILIGTSTYAWAGCPLSDKDNAVRNFAKFVAQEAGNEDAKLLLADCSDDEIKFGLKEFRMGTLGVRVEAVDQYASGKLNVMTNGLEAADYIDRIVLGQVCLGLIETEALNRKLVGLEDLAK